jgi:D-tagatose-1,6-bisphosphate aldolase subunit GatZ/KbaZ
MTALSEFLDTIRRNRAGLGGVAMSCCSAHPLVLRALFRTARRHDTFALVESTSNQVDQYGGYTGMKPEDFVRLVRGVAAEEGFPADRVLLGGDHLGPNTWREQGAAAAMRESVALVSAYVQAGYEKIHLDASFLCAGDPRPLPEELVADRCAQLADACERARGATAPVYVVGTEVPTPGGVREDEGLRVTTPEDVARTLDVFRAAFRRWGQEEAWQRVVGLVVQPGVEFGDGMVHDYRPAPALARAVLEHPGMVYEAHSTDYQSARGLQQLAQGHFCILKVGPWLTYALREGLFALELMERELAPSVPSRFRDTLTQVMRDDPRHWDRYYGGTPGEISYKLAFSYSDRARYYLGRKEVLEAQARLFGNLAPRVPEGLVSQYLPAEFFRVRAGELAATPQDLLVERVCDVMELYLQAGAAPAGAPATAVPLASPGAPRC